MSPNPPPPLNRPMVATCATNTIVSLWNKSFCPPVGEISPDNQNGTQTRKQDTKLDNFSVTFRVLSSFLFGEISSMIKLFTNHNRGRGIGDKNVTQSFHSAQK